MNRGTRTVRRALRRAAATLVCAIACLAAAGSASAAAGLRQVTVDAKHPTGTIRSLQGVAGSPLPGNDEHGDYSAQFNALAVDFVRTHDIDCSGTGDIDGLGPNRIFPNWNADPGDPASYNFGPTDRAILSIVRSGAEVEFNLGHSDLSCAGVGFNNAPPPDPQKWAEIARHVAQHYNDGWANGFHLGIRYWEVWNEPDLVPFWSGTREEFYALYEATARALKSLHRWMQIGGPALTTNNDLTGFRESLLAYIRAHNLPLDFWTIHHYSDFTEDPLDFNRLADIYRQLLDSYGFTRTTIHLNEWNYGLVDRPSPAQRAAYVADSLILMQDSQLAKAAFYRADAHGDLGLINPDGTINKAGHAFEAVGTLNRTPLRLPTSGGDDVGFGVEAGRTQNHGEVRVLVANYEIPPEDQGPYPPFIVNNVFTIPGIATFTLLDRRPVTYADNSGYDLTVNGLPGNGRAYVVSRYRIDDNHDLTLVDQTTQRGRAVHLTATLPAPAVELVVIKPLHGPRD
jgi:xylan 1,4-beta-xylosidase